MLFRSARLEADERSGNVQARREGETVLDQDSASAGVVGREAEAAVAVLAVGGKGLEDKGREWEGRTDPQTKRLWCWRRR